MSFVNSDENNRLYGKLAVPDFYNEKYPAIVNTTFVDKKIGFQSSRYEINKIHGYFHSLYVFYPDAG